jgi:hypothetical protein
MSMSSNSKHEFILWRIIFAPPSHSGLLLDRLPLFQRHAPAAVSAARIWPTGINARPTEQSQ